MDDLQRAIRTYANDLAPLVRADTSREETYYPPVRNLVALILKTLGLPIEVRTSTSERRTGGGIDLPDVAMYDGPGDFIVVAGEVKLPEADLRELANSTERNDQIGRYLARTRVVLLCNVRGFALLTVDPEFNERGPVPPNRRRIEEVVELWPTASDLRRGRVVESSRIQSLAELIETAVTQFAPIAEPETLARILARQARRAKSSLPEEFTQAVSGLMEDFGAALGIAFEGDEGEEFFRSSLIQTVYYGLFAGWLLWARSSNREEFRWRDLPTHIRIPFLGELFYEIQHPTRIAELGLVPYLDIATDTLGRVHRDSFFQRLTFPSLGGSSNIEGSITTAIVYFYEPFLETFDPDLRKQLGVWYTPPDIVRYQVHKVEALLREQLGCTLGFADDNVVVLDPACGTGAYLIEVLHCAAETLRREGIESELGETLLRAICQRVIGFEILTAPFVIAHLQLHLLLAELGAEPARDQRPAVFLTNALTGWRPGAQLALNFPELQAERDASQTVKTDARIIVVIGNPPYNRFAGAPIEEELALIDPYKGIQRRPDGRQIGTSALFARWGVRKHLLDDLYIRFFRLAEERIGQAAEHGIVSFISNSSYLAGRSHPIMRESLCHSFHEIWIDNLNGDKYKTGKLIPEGWPGAGTTDQSIFTTDQDARGIQIGTAITTLIKRRNEQLTVATAHYRDFWGRSGDKRSALLNSLTIGAWSEELIEQARQLASGPREYETFLPEERRKWKLIPYDIVGGFEDWFSLEDLFPTNHHGVNPNRGLEGSVVEMDRRVLEERMRDYYSDMSDDDFCRKHPVICEPRSRYEPLELRAYLKDNSSFSEYAVVPYVVFPFDLRFIYYETSGKLLDERSPELGRNLASNEFLVAVPQPRRISESLPLLTSSLFFLHLHDRGSVGFPAELQPTSSRVNPLFEESHAEPDSPRANISDQFWRSMRQHWLLDGEDLGGEAAKTFIRALFRVCLALCHSPSYQEEHGGSLAQDWAHVPIPRDRDLFNQLANVGDVLAMLLNPIAEPRGAIRVSIGDYAPRLAVLTSVEGGAVRENDLVVTIPHFGAARGGWRSRQYEETEAPPAELGDITGDLYINNHVFFRNVPSDVWSYELGGYPVLKKWLGYRDARRRENRPLSLDEKDHLRSMVQRIAGILALRPQLNSLYEKASADAWTAEI